MADPVKRPKQLDLARKGKGIDSQQLVHDLKNSLHGIRCGIDLLQNSRLDDDERREILTIMKEEQEAAREMVDAISVLVKQPSETAWHR